MAIDKEPVGIFQIWLRYGKLRDSSLTYIPNEKPIAGQQSSANRKRENKNGSYLQTISRKQQQQSIADKEQKT